MANLSGTIKRILSYATADPTDTDYFITDNSSGVNKKFSFLRLKQLLFRKTTQTIETSFLNIQLYRCGGIIFFRMAGYTGTSLTTTDKQIATLPEGFRPVSQCFWKYSVNGSDSEISLTVENGGAVKVKGSKDIEKGSGCNFMQCYIYAGIYPG